MVSDKNLYISGSNDSELLIKENYRAVQLCLQLESNLIVFFANLIVLLILSNMSCMHLTCSSIIVCMTVICCLGLTSGGIFVATGSSDAVVRVYCFVGAVPEKIGELEAHTVSLP